MLIAALVVLAMAGPILRALVAATGAKGPLLIVIDDGFAAAPTWEQRITLARENASAAARASRPVALAPVSHGAEPIAADDAEAVEAKLAALAPVAYAVPHAPALGSIDQVPGRKSRG